MRRGSGLLGCRGQERSAGVFAIYKTLWYSDVFQLAEHPWEKGGEDHYSNFLNEEIEAKELDGGSGLPKDP